MIIERNGYVFRYSGGSFIGVWRELRRDLHVPDDMIEVSKSLNRSAITQNDFHRMVDDYIRDKVSSYNAAITLLARASQGVPSTSSSYFLADRTNEELEWMRTMFSNCLDSVQYIMNHRDMS